MPQFKLDPEWVMAYLDEQEGELQTRLSAEQTTKIMGKIREFTLAIMYKQASRYIVYLESGDETVDREETRAQKTRL